MLIIYNAQIINEGKRFKGYVVVEGSWIIAVGEGMPAQIDFADFIDAQGGYLIPGVIDDQVHFREPGLTHKGDIATESRAAVAGGVTSFMDMPNVNPASTTLSLLEERYDRAAECSAANYSFYLGASNDNIAEIERIDPSRICGVKLFMGSSTGNMLVDKEDTLGVIFSNSPVLVAVHSEDEETIKANIAKYGESATIDLHPVIRSAEACYKSTARAVELATKYNTKLHVLHLSTARELSLFERKPLIEKRITNEVCVHHLWFSSEDYAAKGNLIKWNPAIKTEEDKSALREGVMNGLVDIVATDHAPHTLNEKSKPYTQAPSGAPFVQHSLAVMLEMFEAEKVVEMMCHRPAELFQIDRRGFIREGYYADLVIVEPDDEWIVSKENILYKCGWSPIEGQKLRARITHTLVNGEMVYCNGVFDDSVRAKRLLFNR